MATIDEHGIETGRMRFCPECGSPGEGARFCPECGYPLEAAVNAAEAPTLVQPHPEAARPARHGTPAPAASRRSPFRSMRMWIPIAFVFVAAGIAIAVISLSGSGSDPQAVYRQKLSTVLAPVIAANKTLSGTLTSLHGHSTAAASSATGQAQQTVTSARGALSLLSVPSGSQQLSQQVQQALTEESGYLQAVSSTLTLPSMQNIAQLGPLATSAQSAFVPLAGVAPDASALLTGTGGLSSWASGEVAAAARASAAAAKAAQQKQVQQAANKAAQQALASSGSSNPSSGGSSPAPGPGYGVQDLPVQCGSGVAGSSGVSCAFSENAFYEYWRASGGNPALFETVSAWSADGQAWYTLSCSTGDGVVDCTGYNGSGVSIDSRFSASALLAYTPAQAAAYAASHTV